MDAAVLAAARTLVCEVGYAETTIDAIARRAGVSRTAIYRRWSSKALVLHAAVFPVSDARMHLVRTGALETDLGSVVQGLAAVFERPEVLAAMPGLMADAVADPALRAVFQAGLESLVRVELDDLLAEAAARNEAARGVNSETLLHLITGTMLFRAAARGPDSVPELVPDLTALLVRVCSA